MNHFENLDFQDRLKRHFWEQISIFCVRRKNMSVRAMRRHRYNIPLNGKRPRLMYFLYISYILSFITYAGTLSTRALINLRVRYFWEYTFYTWRNVQLFIQSKSSITRSQLQIFWIEYWKVKFLERFKVRGPKFLLVQNLGI
jgi:hypothetical protein